MWFRVDIFFHHFVVVRFVLFLVFCVINHQPPASTRGDVKRHTGREVQFCQRGGGGRGTGC